jgi:hypothetical protein
MSNTEAVGRGIILLIGSILLVWGAGTLWGGAGFAMALGLVLILFALAK